MLDFQLSAALLYRCIPMSKRTQKKKNNARRKKANHGRKPNMGRNS
jgi:hypothetical protein